jgi:hypothetical protein
MLAGSSRGVGVDCAASQVGEVRREAAITRLAQTRQGADGVNHIDWDGKNHANRGRGAETIDSL